MHAHHTLHLAYIRIQYNWSLQSYFPWRNKAVQYEWNETKSPNPLISIIGMYPSNSIITIILQKSYYSTHRDNENIR